MLIRGLSNQWGSHEDLLASFHMNRADNRDSRSGQRARAMQQLLLHLGSIEGPDLWAGTSHSQLNLCSRDVVDDTDRIAPFLTIEAVFSKDACSLLRYRLAYRKVAGNRPSAEWVESNVDDIEAATRIILEAIAYSGIPQRNCSGTRE